MAQRFETVCPARDKWLIVKLFADDDVEHTQRQCIINAGTDLQPNLRPLGKVGLARIDDDYFWFVLECFEHVEARFTVGPGI